MSTSVIGSVKQEGSLGYDQVTSETTVTNPNLTRTTNQLQEGRTDRALTSESSQSGSKESGSETVRDDARKSNSTVVSAKQSVEKANIAFQISFSVPIMGRFPTGAPGTTHR